MIGDVQLMREISNSEIYGAKLRNIDSDTSNLSSPQQKNLKQIKLKKCNELWNEGSTSSVNDIHGFSNVSNGSRRYCGDGNSYTKNLHSNSVGVKTIDESEVFTSVSIRTLFIELIKNSLSWRDL